MAKRCSVRWMQRRGAAARAGAYTTRTDLPPSPASPRPRGGGASDGRYPRAGAEHQRPAQDLRQRRRSPQGVSQPRRRAWRFHALLGPCNGAGKSTWIGIVSSLVNKTAGTVRVSGIDLDADRDAAMRQIGLVPQELNFNMFEKPLTSA